MDADVILSLAVQEAKELERTFKAANFHTELWRGDFGDPIPALLKLSDSYGNRVDLLIGLRGMEPETFTRILEVPFQGKKLRFIGREDFIAMKAFAGGPMVILDATRAIAGAGTSLDKALLRFRRRDLAGVVRFDRRCQRPIAHRLKGEAGSRRFHSSNIRSTRRNCRAGGCRCQSRGGIRGTKHFV